ncbi:MAG: phosphonopyruvate decarboxylase [Phycisphaerales bacterium]
MIGAGAFVERALTLGYDWYAGVPCSFLTPLINGVIGNENITYVCSANEGDAVAAAAGAVLGGRRAVVMMQNSGLGNAVNPITSLAQIFRIPVLLVITLRGDPALADEPQHELMGRITGPLLEQMEVPWEFFPDERSEIDPVIGRADELMRRGRRPYALIMRKGSVDGRGVPLASPDPPVRTGAPCRRHHEFQRGGSGPTRREALQRIVAHAHQDSSVVIATTGHTGRELFAIADRPNHLYMVGSMGCASSLGLGLALARPDLRVVVVDGDGAALMRMGNFATVGAYGGSNLVHIVLNNGRHDTTGGQLTASGSISFAGVAEACGYAIALEGDGLALLDRLFGERPDRGPSFAELRIRPGAGPGLPRPNVSPEQVGRRLAAHIGSTPCCC